MTIGFMLVALSACSWLAARPCRMGVLMYGQRLKLGKLVQALRAR